MGWIDGVRRRIDDRGYSIRFTPRRPTSIWSAVNIARVAALTAEGRMQPAGLEAFAARTENRSGIYSYEQPQRETVSTPLTKPFSKGTRPPGNFFRRSRPDTASWRSGGW